MAKLADMPAYEREHLLSKLRPPLGPFPWVTSDKPLSEKRIAIITTAGLSYRSGARFELADASYRAIPAFDSASKRPSICSSLMSQAIESPSHSSHFWSL